MYDILLLLNYTLILDELACLLHDSRRKLLKSINNYKYNSTSGEIVKPIYLSKHRWLYYNSRLCIKINDLQTFIMVYIYTIYIVSCNS